MSSKFKPRTDSRRIEWTDFTFNITGGCNHECEWVMPDGTIGRAEDYYTLPFRQTPQSSDESCDDA